VIRLDPGNKRFDGRGEKLVSTLLRAMMEQVKCAMGQMDEQSISYRLFDLA
jgi:hypothetical protein